MWWCGVDESRTGCESVTGCYECSDELWDPVKGDEFVD